MERHLRPNPYTDTLSVERQLRSNLWRYISAKSVERELRQNLWKEILGKIHTETVWTKSVKRQHLKNSALQESQEVLQNAIKIYFIIVNPLQENSGELRYKGPQIVYNNGSGPVQK